MVAGGFPDSKTVEILNVQTNVWTSGPNLPTTIKQGSMVEHPDGGVVLFGGKAGGETVSNSVYYLPSLTSPVWILLQPLQTARFGHVAIIVPDYVVNCS